MPDPTDDVLEVELETSQSGGTEMATVIPSTVAELLLSETAGNIQANNRDGRAVTTAAMGSLTAGIARVHNELGPVESRAVSGVMATPVASPAVQTGT